MTTFKPGDTVRLKSGGPLMTVVRIDSDGDVHCAWFAIGDESKAHTGRIAAVALTLSE